MITQRDIQGGYLRASYGELVDPLAPVAWFGAGAFATRLAGALPPDQLATVTAIYDDNARHGLPDVAGLQVQTPTAGSEPPRQILLATDRHAKAMLRRVRALWGARCRAIDLFATTGWVDPCDGAAGFARTHQERWRDALGSAQVEREAQGVVDRSARWAVAHATLVDENDAHRFDVSETERFAQAQLDLAIGSVVIVTGGAPVADSGFWAPIIERHHAASSPDGGAVAITWAPREEYPLAPHRSGGALWIPDEATDIVESLYRGSGKKSYTLRFDDGAETKVNATRERTYADLRGCAELARYEAFLSAMPPHAKVLDCATGTGPGAELLRRQGFAVTGVDVSDEAIAFASRRYAGIEFVSASASALPFSDDSFDAVVSIETIEHLADPAAALAEFARVCKPEGVLCLTTPDEGGCDSPFHAVELTAEDLDGALDSVFGVGGWDCEPVPGAEAWHAMVVRRSAAVQM